MSSLSTVKVWCLPPPFSCISTTSTLSEGMVNLSKTKTVRPSFFPRRTLHSRKHAVGISPVPGWRYVSSGFLVHNFKSHEIHLIRHVGAVLYLCMKIKQAVVRIESAEQVLDAERLAPDMLDVPSVVLVDGLRDKVYQFRRFAAQFLQVDVKGVVGAVHLTSVMNEILHLDIQQQRLFRILHIEGVKTSAFGNHGHVGLPHGSPSRWPLHG